MIKAILFDLDDTLLWDSKSIEEAFKATCNYAYSKAGTDPKALESSVREAARELYASYDTYEFTQNIGINPFEGLWGDFLDDHDERFLKLKEIVPAYRKKAWTIGLQTLGIQDSVLGEELSEKFRQERNQRPYVYEDTFRVLQELNGKYQLLLLTNGSPHLQNTKLDKTPELLPYFQEVIISGEVGKGKPDRAMFEHALERLQLQKEEVIMVGDNLNTDILGASNMGITTIWINRRGQTPQQVVPDYEAKELHEVIHIVKNVL
ncbi:haloacid dehalogenase [Bacillus sp. AFS015802]|uniref:HAD family hydrolase n=1 Tax=Bacillus sp. AFS015802 TaxID=2033486 RepID=UPI000BF9BC61|nr:HAD family hydrolase [Bacillus sp. AFS015802]PFA62159.1 haloacid dehalogenase [Bacillus sp. AFS015802]